MPPAVQTRPPPAQLPTRPRPPARPAEDGAPPAAGGYALARVRRACPRERREAEGPAAGRRGGRCAAVAAPAQRCGLSLPAGRERRLGRPRQRGQSPAPGAASPCPAFLGRCGQPALSSRLLSSAAPPPSGPSAAGDAPGPLGQRLRPPSGSLSSLSAPPQPCFSPLRCGRRR